MHQYFRYIQEVLDFKEADVAHRKLRYVSLEIVSTRLQNSFQPWFEGSIFRIGSVTCTRNYPIFSPIRTNLSVLYLNTKVGTICHTYFYLHIYLHISGFH